MGGKAAFEGYFAEALVVLVDSLSRPDWSEFELEPDEGNTATDVRWRLNGCDRRLVQVKSSAGRPLGAAKAREAARALAESVPQSQFAGSNAPSLELVLAGPVTEGALSAGDEFDVRVLPRLRDVKAAYAESAHHLDRFVWDRWKISVPPDRREQHVRAIAAWLIENAGTELRRPEFESFVHQLVGHDAGLGVPTVRGLVQRLRIVPPVGFDIPREWPHPLLAEVAWHNEGDRLVTLSSAFLTAELQDANRLVFAAMHQPAGATERVIPRNGRFEAHFAPFTRRAIPAGETLVDELYFSPLVPPEDWANLPEELTFVLRLHAELAPYPIRELDHRDGVVVRRDAFSRHPNDGAVDVPLNQGDLLRGLAGLGLDD